MKTAEFAYRGIRFEATCVGQQHPGDNEDAGLFIRRVDGQKFKGATRHGRSTVYELRQAAWYESPQIVAAANRALA